MTWMGWAAIIFPCVALVGVGFLGAFIWKQDQDHDGH